MTAEKGDLHAARGDRLSFPRPAFLRLSADERAVGLPASVQADDHVAPYTHRPETPRQALEALVQPALESGPVYVLFSGGRDSSAVLAVATGLARRIGAPDPIPVIARHPRAPDSDESEWQELVLDHLRITERVQHEFDGEQSLLGELTLRSLRTAGLLWPAAVHVQPALLTGLPRGTVLTGEGGDALIDGGRITPVLEAIRAGRPRRTLREARWLMRSGGPRFFSTAIVDASPWLTPDGGGLARRILRTRRVPVRWDAEMRAQNATRLATFMRRNLVAIIAAQGFVGISPFENGRFVAAMLRDGGPLGRGGRTALMRRLFSDVLPDVVLSRTTKASFSGARFTEREVGFARGWRGEGVDHRFIDAAKLRDAWLSGDAPPIADIHLHAAWLGQQGLPPVPAGS